MKVLLFFGVVLMAQNANSQFGDMPPITEIEGADLICEQPGASFAIDTEKGKERVWQSDPGETEGLELKVLSAKTIDCEGCYAIWSELSMFGDSSRIIINIWDDKTEDEADVTLAAVTITGEDPGTIHLNCTKPGEDE